MRAFEIIIVSGLFLWLLYILTKDEFKGVKEKPVTKKTYEELQAEFSKEVDGGYEGTYQNFLFDKYGIVPGTNPHDILPVKDSIKPAVL